MSNEFVLRPEELYILGTVMKAEYIDYDYIAALQDITRNFQQMESMCMLNLARTKLVRKRLSGETSVHPPLEKLLKNVFFGKRETVLDVVVCGKEPKRITCRIHYLSGSATLVVAEDGSLRISPITDEEVKSLIRSALGRNARAPQGMVQADASAIKRMIIAKCAQVDIGSRSCMLFEQNGALYLDVGDDRGRPVSNEQAAGMLYTMLKGE